MKNERPAGITLIVIVFFVLGGLSLLWGGLVFGVGGLSSLIGGLFGAERITSFGDTSAWSGFMSLVVAVVQIVVAFGLLGVKKWAWLLAVIGIGLTVIQGVVQMVTGGLYGFMCGSISVVIPVIMLIYLLTPGVRRAFG